MTDAVPEPARRLVVQQSFPRPRPTTNPYLVMLRDAVGAVPGVEVRTFDWKGALLGRYDVFHVHWPEILVSGQSPLKALVRQGLTVALVVKLWATRTAIVRTEHNLELPTGISRRERALLRWIERRTTLWVRLNAETPERTGALGALIPHGHYVDWFSRWPWPDREAGRVSYFGFIRRYKGVDGLLRAFRGVRGDDRRLHAAGKPSSPDLARGLEELAADDPRVSLDLRFLDDEALIETVRRAELVVLPYREMHNSGGVLTALSLGRPVLVPANEVNARLADEVGAGWVQQYADDLDAADVERALDAASQLADDDVPDLSARDWDRAGEAHVEAYRRAVAAVRRGRA
ncbi:glycosyltransferase [Frigoribacterium sp. PvP032]|uniref:glycosyltransferase n=1 Tax=Frigoribacterium sp. PvP032 TaxID=2806589 RepID=UPI001B6233E8|nr:glycosyltransferase [Frigoribacterium sp. PvP032]MBP1191895.1 glycosyltransferase involved in cell wall biosynthesis [Frigoribacterium sp. PvP032]